MNLPRATVRPVAALAVLLFACGSASAARARFHYVPSPGGGPMTLAPFAPGAPGERLSAFGNEPYRCPPPRVTWIGCYRHTFSGCTVQVPLGLPPDTPTIQHRANRIIFNYGSYTVDVVFLEDGSVDVVYSNGLFRDI
jgi:hypothetical protein